MATYRVIVRYGEHGIRSSRTIDANSIREAVESIEESENGVEESVRLNVIEVWEKVASTRATKPKLQIIRTPIKEFEDDS